MALLFLHSSCWDDGAGVPLEGGPALHGLPEVVEAGSGPGRSQGDPGHLHRLQVHVRLRRDLLVDVRLSCYLLMHVGNRGDLLARGSVSNTWQSRTNHGKANQSKIQQHLKLIKAKSVRYAAHSNQLTKKLCFETCF